MEKNGWIDTHLHVWNLDEFELPWLSNIGELRRTYSLEEYIKEKKNFNVDKAIYIEVNVARNQFEKESAFILDSCKNDDCKIKGAIIACNLEEEDTRDYLNKYINNTGLKGVRRVLHADDAPKSLCLNKTFIENIKYLGQNNLLFEACIRCEEINDLLEMTKKTSETIVILDHLGNPNNEILSINPSERENHQWFKSFKEFANLDNTVCKISTLSIPYDEKMEGEVESFIEFTIDTFGEDKIIFGGNWPVSEIFWGIDNWSRLLEKIAKKRGNNFYNKLFFKNAKKIYNLKK